MILNRIPVSKMRTKLHLFNIVFFKKKIGGTFFIQISLSYERKTKKDLFLCAAGIMEAQRFKHDASPGAWRGSRCTAGRATW